MKAETFHSILEKPELVAQVDIDELREMAHKYSYSQVIQLLYAMRLRYSSEHLFDRQLSKTAIITNNRKILFDLFEETTPLAGSVAAEGRAEPEERAASTFDTTTRIFEIDKNNEGDHSSETPKAAPLVEQPQEQEHLAEQDQQGAAKADDEPSLESIKSESEPESTSKAEPEKQSSATLNERVAEILAKNRALREARKKTESTGLDSTKSSETDSGDLEEKPAEKPAERCVEAKSESEAFTQAEKELTSAPDPAEESPLEPNQASSSVSGSIEAIRQRLALLQENTSKAAQVSQPSGETEKEASSLNEPQDSDELETAALLAEQEKEPIGPLVDQNTEQSTEASSDQAPSAPEPTKGEATRETNPADDLDEELLEIEALAAQHAKENVEVLIDGLSPEEHKPIAKPKQQAEEPHPEEPKLTDEEAHEYSFSRWLQQLNEKNTGAEQESETLQSAKAEKEPEPRDSETNPDFERKIQLLDEFVEKLPELKKRRASESKITKDTPKPKPTLREDESLVTETLAKVYIKQKHYKKAIKAYEILKLKYPEKSSYFAAQISEVKSLASL